MSSTPANLGPVPQQRLTEKAQGTVDDDGNITIRFASVPSSLAWTGTVSVVDSEMATSWSVALSLQSIGSTLGTNWFGPFVAHTMETLTLGASGLTPGVIHIAAWIGYSIENDLAPFPFPTSITTVNAIT